MVFTHGGNFFFFLLVSIKNIPMSKLSQVLLVLHRSRNSSIISPQLNNDVKLSQITLFNNRLASVLCTLLHYCIISTAALQIQPKLGGRRGSRNRRTPAPSTPKRPQDDPPGIFNTSSLPWAILQQYQSLT